MVKSDALPLESHLLGSQERIDLQGTTSPDLNEVVIDISLDCPQYPLVSVSKKLIGKVEDRVVRQTRNLLACSLPDEATRDYISRLIAQANGKNAFGDCLERFPEITNVSEEEKDILLDLVMSKPYSQRIQELIVPLIYTCKGSDVQKVMRNVFDTSINSDPVATGIAGAWLLRECHTPLIHERVASRAVAGDYQEILYGTSRIHALPAFVKGLLYSEEPLAVAIAGSSCDYRLGSYYRKNAQIELSLRQSVLKFVVERIGSLTTDSLINQAYSTIRDLLQYPTHPVIGTAMIKLLAESNKTKNLEYLNKQLNCSKGWLASGDLIAGKRKFEIKKALGLI